MRARTVLGLASLYRSGDTAFPLTKKGNFMFYRKNLPGWERALRVIAGIVLIAWG